MRMRNRLRGAVAAALVVLAGPAAFGAEQDYFQAVAEPGTPAPDGTTWYSLSARSIDGRRVMYWGEVLDPYAGWQYALWATEGAKDTLIVNSSTVLPELGVTAWNFYGGSQSGGTSVFQAEAGWDTCGQLRCSGIFRHGPTGLSAVATTKDIAPGRSEQFASFGQPIVDGGMTAFRGSVLVNTYNEVWGVYADLDGGGAFEVANWLTPFPGGIGTVVVGEVAGVDYPDVYFTAQDSITWELALLVYSGGQLSVAFDATDVPETDFDYFSIQQVGRRGGTTGGVVYGVHPDDAAWYWAVYSDSGSGVTKVFDSRTPLETPDGEVVAVSGIGDLAVDAGGVAFLVYDTLGSTHLVVAGEEGIRVLLSRGMYLGGQKVQDILLPPEGLSGERLSFGVTFEGVWQQHVYMSFAGVSRHEVVGMPDLDANGYPELLVRALDPVTRTYALQARDLYTAGMTSFATLGDEPVMDMALFETAGGEMRVATFGVRDDGAAVVRMRSPATGAGAGGIYIGPNRDPLAITVLPDMNGNGSPELGLLVRTATNAVRITVVDSLTKAVIADHRRASYPDPIGLLSLGDVDGIGGPEVGLVLDDYRAGEVRLLTINAATGTTLRRILFSQGFEPVEVVRVAGQDGNGAPGVAFLGYRASDGATLVQVRDALTGVKLAQTSWVGAAVPADLATTPAEDRLGVLSVLPDGRSTLRVLDAGTLGGIGLGTLRAISAGRSLAGTLDADGSGAPEFAALGEHFGMSLVEVCDSTDLDPVRYIFVP